MRFVGLDLGGHATHNGPPSRFRSPLEASGATGKLLVVANKSAWIRTP